MPVCFDAEEPASFRSLGNNPFCEDPCAGPELNDRLRGRKVGYIRYKLCKLVRGFNAPRLFRMQQKLPYGFYHFIVKQSELNDLKIFWNNAGAMRHSPCNPSGLLLLQLFPLWKL